MTYEWLLLMHFVGIGAGSFACYRAGRRAGRKSCFRQRRVWPSDASVRGRTTAR